jgi:acetyl esterase
MITSKLSLHPVLCDILEAARKAGRPQLSSGTPAASRALLSASCAALGAGPEVGIVSDLKTPTRGGEAAARLFRPKTPPRGLIIYVHGGGWVLGTLTDFDALSRTLVDRSGCALLLVDYRLAPEFPFPAGLEDVEDCILWASNNVETLASADAPIVLAGDSAGANLATVAAATLRHKVSIALQLLLYPVTDCDVDNASYQEFAEGLFVTRADMQWFFNHYASEELWPDSRISPLRTADLSGCAPAWIATAEFDVLRDEAEAYARKLADAGVDVTMRRCAGMGHGFARMMNLVDIADLIVSDAASAIVRHCHDYARQRQALGAGDPMQ